MTETPAEPVVMAVPPAPVLGAVTPGDNQLSIAFTQAAATPDVVGWQIKVGNGPWKDSNVAASPLVVKNLANGKEASIQMRAGNVEGFSAASNTVKGTPTDANPANDNGWTDASPYANAGAPVPNLDWNDPDD